MSDKKIDRIKLPDGETYSVEDSRISADDITNWNNKSGATNKGTLRIGDIEYNGSQDVVVPSYKGEYRYDE